jgi:hypothetical protein
MNPTDLRAVTALAMSEEELQTAVTHLATLYGWRWYHVYDSRRSNPGFPDLVLTRRGRLIFCELKSQRGKVRPEQQDWLNDLDEVERKTGGLVVARLWRPSDWLSNEIEEVLR